MVFLAADGEAHDFVVAASGCEKGGRVWNPGARLSAQTGKVGLVVRRRATLDRRDFDAEPPIVREQVCRTEPVDFKLDVVTPVSVGDKVVAVIAVGDAEPTLASTRTALDILAEFSAVVLRALAARAKAERFANQDTLTGMGNKSWFNAVAADETYRVRQEGGRAALVMFCVDHYQHYLQRNGHQAADKLIRGIAQVIRPLAREQDLLARWSGDEFVVLMPDADLPAAWDFATRARRAVVQVDWPFGATQPGRRVTICAAISGLPGTGDTLETLIEAASQTINEARSAGGATTGSILYDPQAERQLAEAAAAKPGAQS
jgi:diguanylate cyclase (GGDEF)-like protein